MYPKQISGLKEGDKVYIYYYDGIGNISIVNNRKVYYIKALHRSEE